MQGDATAFPLDRPPVRAERGPLRRGRSARRESADLAAGRRLAAGSLAAIVVLSLFLVLIAANRPSLLAPTTHTGFYPHWMAGPLGGLLPGLTNNSTALRFMFTGAMIVMFIGYVLLLRHAGRLRARWVIGAILAVHAIFLISPPLALTDMFNYINYGRMEVVHSLNPYTTIPVLEPHNDPSYILSNWHELLSPYGPLFTLITFAVVPLGVAGSFWALKALLVAASLTTILLVWKCARLLGRDPLTAAVLVGLNPIVLVWGLGAGHNDFLMIVCVMFGFYLLLRSGAFPHTPLGARPSAPARTHGGVSGALRARRRELSAALSGLRAPTLRRIRGWLLPLSAAQCAGGAAFVIAAGIKASGAVLIPVVLAGLLRSPRAFVQVALGMLAGALMVAVVSLAAFGVHLPDLSTQGSLVAGESVPNLVGLAIGLGGESNELRKVMVALLIVAVLACCYHAWRERDALTASGWSSVALLLALSWVLPWYVLWVLPMAALSQSRRLRAASLVLGAYLIIAWAPVSGKLWHAIGFRPERTSLGRLHQRYVKELLN
jgi:hypothetical protein